MKRLFLFIFCGMLCAASCSEKADGIVASGTTGPLTWTLSKGGTLTISGKGAMPDYNHDFVNKELHSPPPWEAYQDDIIGVIIGNDVSSIGKSAFRYYRKMTSVAISNSVTVIGVSAFLGCENLQSVGIPNSVIMIEVGAFYHCTNLSSVTIGQSVVEIGGFAFRMCTGLTRIVNYQKIPQIIQVEIDSDGVSDDPFIGVDYDTCTLLVPAGSIDAYKAAGVWKHFVSIQEIR